MFLDILRLMSLSLALFFLGINLAILKNHYNRPGMLVVLGRLGITVSIITVMFLRLTHNVGEFPAYVVNMILIPSLICSIIGGLQFYREQSRIEHKKSGEGNGKSL
jgi:hypothetical protein